MITMDRSGTMNFQGDPLVESLSSRVTRFLGKRVNQQGELRQKE
jgi:hypothetical protein